MKIIDAPQGSALWLEIRQKHFTASEAPAMLGLSKYMSRSELLRQKATGIAPEVDGFKQALFDRGHEAEAVARPLAEAIIGEDLFPCTGSIEIDGIHLLASFDGLTMDESVSWECKLSNDAILTMLEGGELDGTYWPQVEQQLLVSGATRALFTACDGETITGSVWYESKPERRAQLLAGWKQFSIDLTNFQYVEVIPAAVAAPVKELPTLFVQARGEITSTNMPAFRAQVTEFLGGLNMTPTTDQQFADSKEIAKKLRECAASIKAKKEDMLAQTVTIGDVAKEIDQLAAMTNAAALALEKAVAAEEENRKGRLIAKGKQDLAEHIAALNKRIGMQIPPVAADFAAAIKGKRLLAAMQNGINTELSRAKIEASAIADKIEANMKTMTAAGHEHLFRDYAVLAMKAPDDLALVISTRIDAEQKRISAENERILEAERAKIRAEEEAKAAAKAKAEQDAAQAEFNRQQGLREAEAVRIALAEQQKKTPPEPVASVPAANHGAVETPARGLRETTQDNGATMKLGDIGARLGFMVTTDFLESLGFKPVRIEKAARLYRQCDFQPICDALIRHIQQVSGTELLAAA